MSKRTRTKLVREGRYMAEVEVELVDDETGWSSYLTPSDAIKLDDVRDALRRGDIVCVKPRPRIRAAARGIAVTHDNPMEPTRLSSRGGSPPRS